MNRKNPIRLRWSPLSDSVFALRRYTEANGALKVLGDGKDDVTADFDALVLERLIPNPQSNIIGILDGAATGQELTAEERAEIGEFRERLVEFAERHNARLGAVSNA